MSNLSNAADIAEQFEVLLGSAKQSWLLGAGASFPSNVPLMYPLTKRVYHCALEDTFAADDQAKAVIGFIQEQIPEGDHIEVFLTQMGDFISLAERSRDCRVNLGALSIHKIQLTAIHVKILSIIADTVRWGYKPAVIAENGDVIEPETVGVRGSSIVTVDAHERFIRAIFNSRRAGLEIVRGRLEFFTTNYDTLIEDALSLNEIEYCDGFSGGGVGFWNPRTFSSSPRAKANVTKLHGSVDWYRSIAAPSPLLRTRSGDCYPPPGGSVMIYPQATKYINAQLNPFAELFQRLRERLADGKDHALLTCGYSFGDEHINTDIEIAMSNPKSQLIIVAFVSDGAGGLPPRIERWRMHSPWRDRLYIASPRGLYRGAEGPEFEINDGRRDWWTFDGVTNLLAAGLPADVQEAIQ